jgi:hypothetical protein
MVVGWRAETAVGVQKETAVGMLGPGRGDK